MSPTTSSPMPRGRFSPARATPQPSRRRAISTSSISTRRLPVPTASSSPCRTWVEAASNLTSTRGSLDASGRLLAGQAFIATGKGVPSRPPWNRRNTSSRSPPARATATATASLPAVGMVCLAPMNRSPAGARAPMRVEEGAGESSPGPVEASAGDRPPAAAAVTPCPRRARGPDRQPPSEGAESSKAGAEQGARVTEALALHRAIGSAPTRRRQLALLAVTAVLAFLLGTATASAELTQRGDLFIRFDGGITPRRSPPHDARPDRSADRRGGQNPVRSAASVSEPDQNCPQPRRVSLRPRSSGLSRARDRKCRPRRSPRRLRHLASWQWWDRG